MSAYKKPWKSGEFGHDLAAMANLWLDTHGPSSEEPPGFVYKQQGRHKHKESPILAMWRLWPLS